MKKLLAIIMAGLMLFSLAACGGGEKGENGAAASDGSELSIDFEAEGTQVIGEAAVTADVLKKTVEEYLEGNTMFAYSNDARTYGDFVNYIGCDATEYQFNADKNERTFIWKATDNDTAMLAITFAEADGEWKLYAAGSTNLDLDVNK